MTKKDLIQNIYNIADSNGGNSITLNINRGKYKIEKLWSVDNVVIVFINRNNIYSTEFIEELKITDQIFIYRKLLKLDIDYRIKKNYPIMSKEGLLSLSTHIFNSSTIQRNKVHRN